MEKYLCEVRGEANKEKIQFTFFILLPTNVCVVKTVFPDLTQEYLISQWC